MTMALQGVATQYNQILHQHHGVTMKVLPGAFDRTLQSGVPVRFLLGHHDGQCIGSTADNLELFSDATNLVFRFRFPDTELGRQARAIAQSNEHTAVSIGFDYRGANKEVCRYGGTDVMVIKQAWLFEVTWLHGLLGAVQQAFASYENVDNSSLR